MQTRGACSQPRTLARDHPCCVIHVCVIVFTWWRDADFGGENH